MEKTDPYQLERLLQLEFAKLTSHECTSRDVYDAPPALLAAFQQLIKDTTKNVVVNPDEIGEPRSHYTIPALGASDAGMCPLYRYYSITAHYMVNRPLDRNTFLGVAVHTMISSRLPLLHPSFERRRAFSTMRKTERLSSYALRSVFDAVFKLNVLDFWDGTILIPVEIKTYSNYPDYQKATAQTLKYIHECNTEFGIIIYIDVNTNGPMDDNIRVQIVPRDERALSRLIRADEMVVDTLYNPALLSQLELETAHYFGGRCGQCPYWVKCPKAMSLFRANLQFQYIEPYIVRGLTKILKRPEFASYGGDLYTQSPLIEHIDIDAIYTAGIQSFTRMYNPSKFVEVEDDDSE